jgi:ribosomal-protein-alanine N-acetyltransferase
MTGLEVRVMKASHISEILEIEKTLFSTPWTRGMFEQEVAGTSVDDVPGSYAVVATLGGRVVGYAIAWFIELGVHLMNIAVRKEFQRQGIGKRLLNDLIETASAAGKRIIVLEVRTSNAAAQAFYRRFGFESVGVRPDYYADSGEDAILMAAHLLPRAVRRKRESRKRESN